MKPTYEYEPNFKLHSDDIEGIQVFAIVSIHIP